MSTAGTKGALRFTLMVSGRSFLAASSLNFLASSSVKPAARTLLATMPPSGKTIRACKPLKSRRRAKERISLGRRGLTTTSLPATDSTMVSAGIIPSTRLAVGTRCFSTSSLLTR